MARRKQTKTTEERSIGGSLSDGYTTLTGLFSMPTASGSVVNENTALTLSAVWNAINIYANTIATLALTLAERTPQGGKRPAYHHPCYDLVHFSPNGETTSFALRQSLMLHVMTRGNGYLEIERNGLGNPVALHLMNPRDVKPERDDDTGKVKYRLIHEDKFIPSKNIVHVAGLGFDGISGYSPVTTARQSLGLAMATETLSAAFYGNGAVPSSVIKAPKVLNEEAKRRLRDSINAVHQGADNAGKFMLLDGGMEWVATAFSPADSELLLSRNFSVAEVARWFNLPQHMLGNLDHATFSNIEESNIQFYQLSLMPWLEKIEQELSFKLLTAEERKTYFFRHDINTLLRGNMAARSAYYQTMVNIGVLSVNEVRAEEGMNPIGVEGDAHLVQGAMESIASAANLPVAELDPDLVDTPVAENDVPPETPTLGGEELNALRAVVADPLTRMVRRECVTVRRHAGKDDFLGWLDTFYGDHRSRLATALTPALSLAAKLAGIDDDAAVIAGKLADESRAALAGLVVLYPPDELPGAVERVLTEWETTRVDSLVSRILG